MVCFRPQPEVVPLPVAGFSFATAPVLLCAPVVLSARALLHTLVSALTDPSVRRVLVTVGRGEWDVLAVELSWFLRRYCVTISNMLLSEREWFWR